MKEKIRYFDGFYWFSVISTDNSSKDLLMLITERIAEFVTECIEIR